MSSLETRKIEPQSSTTVTLGEAGDTVAVPAGAVVKTNTVKDSGGNTILTSDGAGTLSSVNSAIAGSMTFISSQTAGVSATIDFTSGIDSTYDEYVFYLVNMSCSGNDASLGWQANAVGASGFNETITSTSFHAQHTENNTTAAALTYATGSDQAQGTAYQHLSYEQGGGASYPDMCTSGELHIFAPSNTTYVKHFHSTFNSVNVSHGPTVPSSDEYFIAGYINSALAMDEISFKYTSGTINAGTIYLYGIK